MEGLYFYGQWESSLKGELVEQGHSKCRAGAGILSANLISELLCAPLNRGLMPSWVPTLGKVSPFQQEPQKTSLELEAWEESGWWTGEQRLYPSLACGSCVHWSWPLPWWEHWWGRLGCVARLRLASLQKPFHTGMIIMKIIPCTCVAFQCLQMLSQMHSHLRAKEAKSQPREISFSHGS